MSQRAYMGRECYVCGQRVSTNGLAQSSHMRKHVREGKVAEFRKFGHANLFVRPTEDNIRSARQAGYVRRSG